MQTNEEKQFRLNPQMLIMLAVVLLALALPVAMSIYAVQMALAKPAAEPRGEESGTEPLRRVLEDLATERLAGESLAPDRVEITLTSPDPKKEQARIEALARDWEASALPSAEGEAPVSVLVSLPREKARGFLQKLGSDPAAIPWPKEQTRLWVEIVVKDTGD